MNKHSVICVFIFQNTDWEEKLNSLGIRVLRASDGRAIFNYGPGCDFFNPLVQEARGIIIDLNSLEVVCWPFRKFGNWNEPYADTIDWESARVMDKIDGSIMKLYWWDGLWHWATNSTIEASEAHTPLMPERSFEDTVKRAVNYGDIPFENLDPDCTYIFELVSPETQVVIHYPETKIYHTGIRNNVTGQESYEEIGVEKPRQFFGDCNLDYWKYQAEHTGQDDSNPEREGFVVVDKDYHRVKIKTPEYFTAHRLANNHVLTKENAIALILEDDEEKQKIFMAYSGNRTKFYYYRWQVAELENEIEQFLRYARKYYDEVEHDRKALALAIKGHPLADFGFRAIGNDKSVSDLVKDVRLSALAKIIDDYPGSNHVGRTLR